MKKKNHIKAKFSTILLFILAILLCAAPCGWAISYDSGEHYVEEDIDWLHVGADTTVNLYADVSQYIYAYPGSVLNIHSGNVALYIIVMPGEPDPVVTVYGTDFGGDGDFSIPGQVSYSGGTLTGYYADGSAIDLLFYSGTAVFLQNTETNLIDIKPGSDLNSINLKSRGVVPVAVLTTGDFDAGTIDPGTVKFAGAEPVRSTLEDVDEDGDLDMLFHFKTQKLNLYENSTKATLTGETFGEVGIEGTDTVRIVQSKKK
jgi:hypothetical protein